MDQRIKCKANFIKLGLNKCFEKANPLRIQSIMMFYLNQACTLLTFILHKASYLNIWIIPKLLASIVCLYKTSLTCDLLFIIENFYTT